MILYLTFTLAFVVVIQYASLLFYNINDTRYTSMCPFYRDPINIPNMLTQRDELDASS